MKLKRNVMHFMNPVENSSNARGKNKSRGLKKNLWIIFFSFGVVGLGSYICLFFFTDLTDVPLHSFTWADSPAFVAMDGVERNQQTGLLVVRLVDGQEQFLPGEWQVSFAGQEHLYVFGTFPAEETRYNGQQLFLFKDDEIIDLKIKNTPGIVTGVFENSTLSSLRITSQDEVMTYFCFTKVVDGEALACNQLNVENGGQATWNPDNEKEILVSKSSGEIYTYNFATPGLIEVDPEQDSDRFSFYRNILESSSSTVSRQPSPQAVRVLNWFFLSTSTGWEYTKIPFFSSTAVLNDQGLIINLTRTNLSVYDLSTQTKTEVFSDNGLDGAILLTSYLSTAK